MYIESLIAKARSRKGNATWVKHASLHDAPGIFNCFTLVQWLWRPYGIIVPDHILVWNGADTVSLGDARAGDLIFTVRRYRTLQDDDFGHVGVLTSEGTVVHATRWKGGVVEDPLSDFIARDVLGVRRIRAQLPP